MSKLPVISGEECIKALNKAGFFVIRQKGSHISLIRQNPFAQVVVPNHHELDRGTLRSIIRQSGLSVDEFAKLLK
ncbi:MAG: type II toxin-antitoxin system HicA family toxin [Anaerolineales bacterium]|nr:type II toxin-antitoxin system HicA family toxin [Anaerolineales bacterium]